MFVAICRHETPKRKRGSDKGAHETPKRKRGSAFGLTKWLAVQIRLLGNILYCKDKWLITAVLL